jgi:hypothetical protein
MPLQDLLISEETTNVIKVRKMPQRVLLIIGYIKSVSTPLIGFASYIAFIDLVDVIAKPLWGLLGALIIAYFTYLGVKAKGKTTVEVVGIESKVKALEVTENADIDKVNLTLEIFDRAILEAEKGRSHFTEELQTQRIHFSAQLKEARNHYEAKEAEIRESYHAKANAASELHSRTVTRLVKIEVALKNFGIQITDDAELLLPATFERRKFDG